MIEIGIMLEGQEDLTWERFFRLAQAVEDLGFDHLFRSDHLTPLDTQQGRETLALWPSLTALALRTERIRFGPLVCPMTFRHPSMLAKMAASVSDLSGGRLDLGLGAGWFKAEHHMFGIPYPGYGERLALLDEGATIIKGLFTGEPISYAGDHYQVNEAVNYPLPENLNIIIGGKGEKTLQIVARHADEWNFTYAGVEQFKAKSDEVDAACAAIDRDPASLRRSLMIPFAIGRDDAAITAAIASQRHTFTGLPDNLADWRAAGLIGGTPEAVVEQLNAFVDAGVSRFMLQQNALDDLDSLALLAESVLPHFR